MKGIRDKRLIYRHWFNAHSHKALFYASMTWQAWLGLTREVPHDIQMMIGGQWWCLRRRTIEAVLYFCRTRSAIMRFLRTTCIPDEIFQAFACHLVTDHEIKPRTLTFRVFTD